MTAAEDALWGLRQGGLRLEKYVEEFLELSNRVSWHYAALGACFQLGLDDETIRCDLPVGDFPRSELINLILFLNGSDVEVEEIPSLVLPLQLERAASPQLTPRREPPHTSPTAPTACPTPKPPLSSEAAPSSRPPCVAHSRPPSAALSSQPPFAAHSSPPSAGKSRPPFAAHSRPPFAALSRPPSAVHSSLPPSAAHSRPPTVPVASPPAVPEASPPASPLSSPEAEAHVPLLLLVAYEGISALQSLLDNALQCMLLLSALQCTLLQCTSQIEPLLSPRIFFFGEGGGG